MLFARSIQRLSLTSSVLSSSCRARLPSTTVRWASVNSSMSNFQPTPFPWTSTVKTSVTDKVAEHLSTLRPFTAPPAPGLQQPIQSPLVEEGMQLTSVLRKRRLKMNKHKHKKLRKRTRALRKRLGK